MKETEILNPIQADFPTIIPHVDRVADFIKFAQWFATPHELRKQKNQKDFARLIGASEDTLTDWKRHQYFWPLVQQFIGDWLKERVPDVLNGLYKKACKKGHAKDVEMFTRLAGIGLGEPKNKE
ncbi:MAG: hypothetical protein NTY61_01140 [Candidatus Parcubacteria bacterium]|nr:hypothetical protein [Candidatus Parcubacteria bacterium]